MSTLYPNSYQYELMKYNGHPAQSLVTEAFKGNGTWVAQQKYDGALYMLEKIDDNHIYLFARTKSKKTGELVEKSANVPHIIEWAKSLPNDTILLGEIYVPGGKSNDVTKIMGCLPARAISRQFDSDEFEPVHYYVFDCIRWNGYNFINTGFVARFKHFQDWYKTNKINGYVEQAHVYTDNFEQVLHDIFAEGGEGLVFKRFDAIYEPGKRPTRTYFKMKEHLDSIDLVCIGLEDPIRKYSGKELETWRYWIERGEKDQNGAFQWYPTEERSYYNDYKINPHIYMPVTKPWYYGWKNSMVLGLYKDGELVEVGKVASGLTDTIRKDMSENPDNYIGQVVEVEAMSTTKDGALRHPVFIRMRDDKDPQDCKYEGVFNV